MLLEKTAEGWEVKPVHSIIMDDEEGCWKFKCGHQGCLISVKIPRRADKDFYTKGGKRAQIYRYDAVNEHLGSHMTDSSQLTLDHFRRGN